ncbi:MAG: AMP-binding protein, partial [Planctomycetaceae bacterium]
MNAPGIPSASSSAGEPPVVLQRRLLAALRSAGGRLKVADTLGTRLTGRQLLTRILAARKVLDAVLDPDERMVGVMLPSCAAGVVVNAALALSGRVSVNLNYTTSQSVLDLCIERARLRRVISSPAFLARVRLKLDDRLLDARSLKDRLRFSWKIAAFFEANILPLAMLERRLGLLRIKPDDPLTVIFTSGSTGDPKGVVLTVENVGSNVRAIDSLVHLSAADVALGVLPFFHSYGYTATLWTPLTLEPACVYHTNPLDAQAVGKLARDHHATILMATPTFLRCYVRRTPPEDLSTLEVVFAAAEKLPRDVSDAFERRFGVRPCEAYGATELAPLVAANVPPSRHVPGRPVDAREGTVGRPIPGCRARITARDDGRELSVGEEGMLWISGPNVMQGYLDRPDLTADVIHDGWYRTGDIARIDTDGFITITGRQSRFSKIGGEMVPHVPVEEAVNEILRGPGSREASSDNTASTDADGELLAVVCSLPDPRKGERLVVLHLPTRLEPHDGCRQLATRGLPHLWLPSPESGSGVPTVPVLG